MRSAALALMSVGLLAACNPGAPSGSGSEGGNGLFPNLATASYRAEATITGDNGQTLPLVMIRDGANVRVEMNAPQGATTMITNASANETYVISNAGGRTIALRSSMDGFDDPARDWSSDLASTATRTGTCNVAGEGGEEWTRGADADVETVCVTHDGIVLRATKGGRTTWETTNVQRGPQSADLFTLPPGVQVMDLGNMGAAMNEAMERAKAAGQ
jgi:hypothetical protein